MESGTDQPRSDVASGASGTGAFGVSSLTVFSFLTALQEAHPHRGVAGAFLQHGQHERIVDLSVEQIPEHPFRHSAAVDRQLPVLALLAALLDRLGVRLGKLRVQEAILQG